MGIGETVYGIDPELWEFDSIDIEQEALQIILPQAPRPRQDIAFNLIMWIGHIIDQAYKFQIQNAPEKDVENIEKNLALYGKRLARNIYFKPKGGGERVAFSNLISELGIIHHFSDIEKSRKYV
jgi:hypothetical protein